MASYVIKEADSGQFTLEDSSGSVLTEDSAGGGGGTGTNLLLVGVGVLTALLTLVL